MSKSQQARESLGKFKEQVEVEIDRCFESEIKSAAEISPYSEHMIRQIEEFTSRGGKRLRAVFMCFAYSLLGGDDIERIIRTSVFLEVIQSYILIEDDIMDKSPLRRGGPTVHEIYRKYHEKNFEKKDAEHFGVSMGINAGLIAGHMAMTVLANSGFDSELIVRAFENVNKELALTGHGQIHDILAEVRDDLQESDVLNICKLKTATYSVENPMHVGAILAGASDDDLKLISEYAIPVGVAFQLQDDVLGIYGDEEKLGKSVDSDLSEGKVNIIVLKALEQGTPEQVEVIKNALGNTGLSNEEIDEVRKVIKDTGALEYTQKLARDYIGQAKGAITKMKKWDMASVDFFDGIADYMIEREF